MEYVADHVNSLCVGAVGALAYALGAKCIEYFSTMRYCSCGRRIFRKKKKEGPNGRKVEEWQCPRCGNRIFRETKVVISVNPQR